MLLKRPFLLVTLSSETGASVMFVMVIGIYTIPVPSMGELTDMLTSLAVGIVSPPSPSSANTAGQMAAKSTAANKSAVILCFIAVNLPVFRYR